MIKFSILKKSNKSRARIGVIKTPHGDLETPAFVGVATQATIKTLDSREISETKTQIVIANTFHLHSKSREDLIKKSGGLAGFMNWRGPTMTDSGGFQVFSLGFGKDFGVGKILKYFPKKNDESIKPHHQPKSLKITPKGVYFKSPIDGKEIFIGPKESIKIQEKIGADIIFAFDECTPPLSSYEYAKKALERTHQWARICLETKKSDQAIFGIVQGSKFKDLREESAKLIGSLNFDGYGIGGDLGESEKTTEKIINWTIPHLQENKPRHLLGIGHLKDIPRIIKLGIDTFDCIVPTHYARHGYAFTSEGKLNMNKTAFLSDKKPLDKKCKCFVCQNHSRSYISHLVKSREITGLKLLTFHNLFFFNSFVEEIRKKIKQEKI